MSCEDRASLLIAYPYWNDDVARVVAANQAPLRLVIDSGAFTAWRTGKVIELDDYCRFIENLPVKPWRYFTLDVVGDPVRSRKNYDTMIERGFKPVPIFTRGESPSVLDHYYASSDLVGIGGLVKTENRHAFVNGIMKHVAGRRVHWLGFADINFIKQYRPFMCDASTWLNGPKFGAVALYMGGCRMARLTRGVFAAPPTPEVSTRMRSMGFEPREFAKTASWYGGEAPVRKLSAASALAYSLDIEAQVGTLMFNSVASVGEVKFFLDAYRNRQERRAAAWA